MNRRHGLPIVLLMAIAAIALILSVQHLTAERAAEAEQALQRRALLDILPDGSYDNQPLQQPLAVFQALEHSHLQGGYLATRAKRPAAILFRSVTNGYGGPIELLIAVAPDGKLLGVKTLGHTETPGLGAHIGEAHNPWLAGFKGHSTQDTAWALKKDQGQFDQIAGATLTSRAVINAVHDALRYFDEHRQSLLESRAHE